MSENNFNNNQYNNNNSMNNNQNDFNNGQNNFNQNGFNNGQNNFNQNDFNNSQNNFNQNDFNNGQNNFNQNDFNNGQNNFNGQGNMNFSSKDYTNSFNPMDINQNKVVSAICYIPLLFFLPLVATPNSPYAKFHANQSLLLLISQILVSLLSKFISFRIFRFLFPLKFVFGIIGILLFVSMILGIVNAATGKAKELPVIGSFKILR